MSINHNPIASNVLPRCVNCTYGRDPIGVCDVFNVGVLPNGICRSFRGIGESHTSARSRFPILGKLRSGVVYSVSGNGSDEIEMIRAEWSIAKYMRTEPEVTLHDRIDKSYEIQVKNINGNLIWGRVDLYESGLFVISTPDVRYWTNGCNFQALTKIRMAMEMDGRIPMVNGASRYATTMGCAMGEGHFVRLLDFENGQIGDPVPVLDIDLVSDPAFVFEQETATKVWVEKFQSK